MIRGRRTRIVATLGPASRTTKRVRELAVAGADVFRANFSHGLGGRDPPAPPCPPPEGQRAPGPS